MKKNILLIICISIIFNSCIWKENHEICPETEMQMTWESNAIAIFDEYITKAFFLNGWYTGNDTVRDLILDNYLYDYTVAEVATDTYTLCHNPNLPSDWYYRFETNGAPLSEIGNSWTISINHSQYQNSQSQFDGSTYSYYPYATLLNANQKVTITCISHNKWTITYEASENTRNQLQWTMELPNNERPIDIASSSKILTGNSCFELPYVTNDGKSSFIYLYANIEDPLEISTLFHTQYGKVKIWAERDGERSATAFTLNYQNGLSVFETEKN